MGQGGSVFLVFLRSKVNAREANPPRSFCTVYCDLKSIYVRPPRRSALIIDSQKKLTINDRVESARLISGFPAAKLMKRTHCATLLLDFCNFFVIAFPLIRASDKSAPSGSISQKKKAFPRINEDSLTRRLNLLSARKRKQREKKEKRVLAPWFWK